MAVAREAASPTKVPTWQELLPDLTEVPTITREELLAQFAEVPLTERTLRHWEAVGALPRPIRKWHEGAVRSLYPKWFGEVVAMVGSWREQGRSLGAIANDMPRLLRFLAYLNWAVERNITFMPDELRPAVDDLARRIEEWRGVRIGTAVLAFADDTGQTVSRLIYHRPADGTTDSHSPISEPIDGQ